MHQFVNFLLPEPLQKSFHFPSRVERGRGKAHRSAHKSPRGLMGIGRAVEAAPQGKARLSHGLAKGFAVRLRRYQRQNAGLQAAVFCAEHAEALVSGKTLAQMMDESPEKEDEYLGLFVDL